jgi:tight adherence protein B
MTSRSFRLSIGVLLGTLVLASAAAAAEGPSLAETRGSKFPDRGFVLTLPSRAALDPSEVEVLENGRPVTRFSIVPASQSNGANDFGVVLAIDASDSMEGEPIRAALVAARAFAAERNPNQKIAVVLFNSQTEIVLPLTNDEARIAAALANEPELAYGTRLYDGIQTSIDLLTAAKVRSGSVVVLSDGADSQSIASLDDVTASAQDAHVRVFTVGLRSPVFRAGPLQEIADASGASYIEATSPGKDLPRIYAGLGSALASEYVLRYRSLEGPGKSVRVEVRSRQFDGTATATYVTPALAPNAKKPYEPSLGLRFWSSAGAALLVSALAASLLTVGFLRIVKPRNRSVRERLGEFVNVGLREDEAEAARLSNRFFSGAEKSLLRMRWWPGFKQDLDLGRIAMPAVQIVLWTLVGTLFAMWLMYVITGSKLVALFALAVPFVVRGLIRRRADRVRARFAEQLPDNLQVLASALRAGHSLVGALSVVVDDAPEPARSEFHRVIADEQLGIPLEESLLKVAERMDNRDLEQVALVASLQRRTGGNTAEVLDQVTETIRERFELRRMVKTLTAQGRLSRWIVSFLPLALLLAILAINPNYVKPLFTHGSGRVLLAVAAVMVILGSVVIGRIVRIKV